MNLLKKPDAILFDWDGTLVDTIHVLTRAYNDIFLEFDMPTWTLDAAKKNIRKSAREIFPEIFPGREDRALEIYYRSIEANHLDQLARMQGVDEFLANLKSKNIPLGVISNKRDQYLKREVEYLKWQNYFSAVVGAGRGNHDKPSPEVMEIALNEMGLPLTDLEIWYVGDTEIDLEFAANFGCKKVFISHGFGTLENALKLEPDFVAGSCEELGKQLDTVFNLR